MRQADAMLQRLESSRDLSRTIVHVDMDAFYAAVGDVGQSPSARCAPRRGRQVHAGRWVYLRGG